MHIVDDPAYTDFFDGENNLLGYYDKAHDSVFYRDTTYRQGFILHRDPREVKDILAAVLIMKEHATELE